MREFGYRTLSHSKQLVALMIAIIHGKVYVKTRACSAGICHILSSRPQDRPFLMGRQEATSMSELVGVLACV